jgi:hypothetical protein
MKHPQLWSLHSPGSCAECVHEGGCKSIVVVLTVGHLDHTPENCAEENLRAWCQRCHLRYDAKHHGHTAIETRRAGKAHRELFT